MGRSERSARSRCLPGALVAFLLTASTGALAQSAADKATARQVATEGIELYQAGKYSEALDLLKRAQALYDAPPHLLYIARCQARVEPPQLVEAAENYRLLVNRQLAASAPAVFKRAQEDGQKELAELEPRIPSLEIKVSPADAGEVDLTIDGAAVASAVIGIARPINPGSHEIVVSAPGFAPTKKSVDIPEGETVAVALELTAAEGAEAAAARDAAKTEEPTQEGESTKKDEPSLFGFMVGLRLGAAVPGGTALVLAGQDLPMTDLFKAGGAAELHAGVRFARYVSVAIFGEGSVPKAGDRIPLGTQTNYANDAQSRTLGVKVMVGTPRGQLGGFGEVGFAQQSFSLSSSQEGTNCQVDTSLDGTALRLGGGAVFPIGKWVHLVPFGALSFGSFNSVSVEASDGCSAAVTALIGGAGDRDIASDAQATHTLLTFGVGGDFVFGADAPRE